MTLWQKYLLVIKNSIFLIVGNEHSYAEVIFS